MSQTKQGNAEMPAVMIEKLEEESRIELFTLFQVVLWAKLQKQNIPTNKAWKTLKKCMQTNLPF